MDKVKKMNAKQRAFVREYQKDSNATRAARAAGYSEKTADVQGYQLLQNPLVSEAVKRAEEAAIKEAGVTAVKALTQLANLVGSDVRKLFREDGSLKAPAELDDATAAAVSSIEVFEEYAGRGEDRVFVGYTKKVRLWDKNKALENLLKHLGLLIDRIDHSGSISIGDRFKELLAANERIENDGPTNGSN